MQYHTLISVRCLAEVLRQNEVVFWIKDLLTRSLCPEHKNLLLPKKRTCMWLKLSPTGTTPAPLVWLMSFDSLCSQKAQDVRCFSNFSLPIPDTVTRPTTTYLPPTYTQLLGGWETTELFTIPHFQQVRDTPLTSVCNAPVLRDQL